MVKPSLSNRAYFYARLMRMDKPIGIFLLMWPTLWALWVAAQGMPDMLVFTVFMLGVFLMRSAGCVINDYADRDFDPHVERTKLRPIASGDVTPKEALVLFVVLCLTAFALVLLLNPFTILLSFGGVALAAVYPFMKRYTHLPQIVLGAAFAWAAPMAFAAQINEIPVVAWLLFTATVLWAVAYDTMYAMVDRADDLEVGVKSTAILFGEADRLIIGIIQALVMMTLVIAGDQLEMTWPYYLGLAVAAGLAIYQQYLIKDREPSRCLRAFLNNNWFGCAVFCGIAAHYF
jgi:4-hydroxybenzoate polyprenyltransferase